MPRGCLERGKHVSFADECRSTYPTDLSDEEWTRLSPLIPPAKPGGRPRTIDMREALNASFTFSGVWVLGACFLKSFPPGRPSIINFVTGERQPPPDPTDREGAIKGLSRHPLEQFSFVLTKPHTRPWLPAS